MEAVSKYLLILGFCLAFIGYSFYPYLWYRAWFDLVSLSTCCYLLALYYNTYGRSSLHVFFVFLACVNASIDEILFNPQVIEINEYIGFALAITVTYIFRKKWIR